MQMAREPSSLTQLADQNVSAPLLESSYSSAHPFAQVRLGSIARLNLPAPATCRQTLGQARRSLVRKHGWQSVAQDAASRTNNLTLRIATAFLQRWVVGHPSRTAPQMSQTSTLPTTAEPRPPWQTQDGRCGRRELLTLASSLVGIGSEMACAMPLRRHPHIYSM